MAVKAAIFDMDGTLLDSMPMWCDTCVALLERYGVEDARRVFFEHESLDMDKKCDYYHEALGIGESGEALYRELWAMVARAYRDEVRPFAGARDFLDELHEAGVACVIASSTPPELLRLALEAHGLRHYFSHLFFCGDVGRGKEHPDVYIAAQHWLGTARPDTWVFEDAPFAMRAATRAGFPVCALVNDHDGRDLGFCTRWSAVCEGGYQRLSLSRLEPLAPKVMRVLLVAGSAEVSSPGLVGALAAQSDLVVAVDAGLGVLEAAGVTPDLFCGDGDSSSAESREHLCEDATEVVRLQVEKDDTDLAHAVGLVREHAEAAGASVRMTVSCCSGGRPDHALAVWGVLAQAADMSPRVVEDGFECRILSPLGTPAWRFDGQRGHTVSAIALAQCTCVSEVGTRWELDHAPLALLSDVGVSNRVVEDVAEISCHAGVLAAFSVA